MELCGTITARVFHNLRKKGEVRMSICVNDFQWEPGKNDAEYIKLLKSSRDEWQKIAQKAITKLKTLSKAQEPRVMSLEEVREKKPFVLWVEDIFTGSRVFPVAYIKGIYQDSALDWILDIDAPVEEYNITLRFWTSCPTYEQRSKTSWPNLGK